MYIQINTVQASGIVCGVQYLEVSLKHPITWNCHWTLLQAFGSHGLLLMLKGLLTIIMIVLGKIKE